jgi:maleamate amidohydrolase
MTDTKPHGDNFSGSLGWGAKAALVVVDVCRAYSEPDGPFGLPDMPPVLDRIARLADAVRDRGLPVVWTEVKLSADLATGGLFPRKIPGLKIFAEGAEGGWGALTLPPKPEDLVLTKQYASAFWGTTLASTLHAAGVDTVLVTGVSTSGCVRATATEALNHGFRPLVVGDACADRTPAFHENNLADLDAKYADVIDTAAALAHLNPPTRTT